MGNSLQKTSVENLTREEFNTLIHLYLDGEADKQQVQMIEAKCEQCSNSAAYYEEECEVFNLIRENIQKTEAPQNLADTIRLKISSSPA